MEEEISSENTKNNLSNCIEKELSDINEKKLLTLTMMENTIDNINLNTQRRAASTKRRDQQKKTTKSSKHKEQRSAEDQEGQQAQRELRSAEKTKKSSKHKKQRSAEDKEEQQA